LTPPKGRGGICVWLGRGEDPKGEEGSKVNRGEVIVGKKGGNWGGKELERFSWKTHSEAQGLSGTGGETREKRKSERKKNSL